ncbi:MAG: hypothetical protein HZA54_20895 [Planctomycetes bacterium]|nr:hypothetical protein [Planctomycetota bacterium]
MLFLGRSPQVLDAKNRLCLPAAFRKPFLSGEESRTVFLTIDREDTGACLEVFPARSFEQKSRHLAALAERTPEGRRRRNKFLSEVCEVEFDGQWRILLPAVWLQAAGLTRDVVVVGIGETFKLYHPETLKARDRKDEEDAGRLNLVDFTLPSSAVPGPGA